MTRRAAGSARVEAADFTDVIPAEYRADLVVLLVDGDPVLAIVVEAQLQKDEPKPFTWPVYVAGLRARFECPACVLVITPSELVADWARRPIEVGPGSTFVSFVVGPKAVPVVQDVEAARRDPELVVLSVLRRCQIDPLLALIGEPSHSRERTLTHPGTSERCRS